MRRIQRLHLGQALGICLCKFMAWFTPGVFMAKTFTATASRKAWALPILAAALAVGSGCQLYQNSIPVQTESSAPGALPPRGPSVRPLTSRTFERTPERLARGRYLANGICACFSCHAPPDMKTPGLAPVAGKEGSGFDFTAFGFAGDVAPNITPDRETGAGTWTDDMFARAIREGVGHDGRFLDPSMMPYEFFRSLSDEDLASIVVYIRSLPARRNTLPKTTASPTLVAPNAIPIATPVPAPDLATPAKRGAYLSQIGACQWCHTLRDENRKSLLGLEFGGGDLIPYVAGEVSSANLTRDPSGIGYYDEDQFLKTMRTGKVGARRISPMMPWWYFGLMTDADLKALFAYLRTLKPVHHRVDNTEPVSYCRVCGRRHGAGALN